MLVKRAPSWEPGAWHCFAGSSCESSASVQSCQDLEQKALKSRGTFLIWVQGVRHMPPSCHSLITYTVVYVLTTGGKNITSVCLKLGLCQKSSVS